MGFQAVEGKQVYKGNDGSPRLPSAYQEVEYLQSHGDYYSGEYIDTGVIPTNNTKVEWKMSGWTQLGSTQIFGARVSWFDGGGYSMVADAYQFNNPVTGIGQHLNDGYMHKGSFSQDGFYVDGNLISTPPTVTFTSTCNLWLFCVNNNGGYLEGASMKYYYFKIYESGTLIREFIPCYRKLDNEPGMYDIVNDVFYTNQGSGAFDVGNNTVPKDIEIRKVYKGSVQVRPSLS